MDNIKYILSLTFLLGVFLFPSYIREYKMWEDDTAKYKKKSYVVSQRIIASILFLIVLICWIMGF